MEQIWNMSPIRIGKNVPFLVARFQEICTGLFSHMYRALFPYVQGSFPIRLGLFKNIQEPAPPIWEKRSISWNLAKNLATRKGTLFRPPICTGLFSYTRRPLLPYLQGSFSIRTSLVFHILEKNIYIWKTNPICIGKDVHFLVTRFQKIIFSYRSVQILKSCAEDQMLQKYDVLMRYWFYYSTWLSRSFLPDQNGRAKMICTS